MRSLATQLICAATALMAVLPVVAADVEPQEGIVIEDLPYGQVLYEYYQEDYFRSLTTLLVEEDMGRMPDHAAEAELLRGGLYLSYGLHRQAGEIFERLLAENPEPDVRDRAWFYLGKARFQRGYIKEANKAFKKVGRQLPVVMEAERDSLQAQVDILRGDLGKAEQIIDQWEGPEDWSYYAAYNLGVALIKADRIDEAAIYLNKVGSIEAATEEMYSLRDRANLAMGFALLQLEDGAQAKVALERVRLNGPFSNAALLGFGWADVAQENYREALVPWLELSSRNRLDPAVQESLLAIAYAYRQLSANQQAMEGYAQAIDIYEQEIDRLEKAISAARSGELVESMLSGPVEGFSRWNWALEDLPEREETRYLIELIATHGFQGGLRNYRDLKMLQSHLLDWQSKLDVFDHMLEGRVTAYEAAMADVPESLRQDTIEQYQARHLDLQERLAAAERNRDIVAVAPAVQQQQWARIESIDTGAGDDAATHKLGILKGLLQWEMEKDYKLRLWQQQREMAELGQLVEDSVTGFDRFETDIAAIPGDLESFQTRVTGVAPRVGELLGQIDEVALEQVAALGDIAAVELEEQKQRLLRYRAQAQFAQASIFDRSIDAEAGL